MGDGGFDDPVYGGVAEPGIGAGLGALIFERAGFSTGVSCLADRREMARPRRLRSRGSYLRFLHSTAKCRYRSRLAETLRRR
jgi:hypothetical protein